MAKKISDVKIHKIVGIPITTIQDWKKRDDYRKKLYEMIKDMSEEELKKRVQVSS